MKYSRGVRLSLPLVAGTVTGQRSRVEKHARTAGYAGVGSNSVGRLYIATGAYTGYTEQAQAQAAGHTTLQYDKQAVYRCQSVYRYAERARVRAEAEYTRAGK